MGMKECLIGLTRNVPKKCPQEPSIMEGMSLNYCVLKSPGKRF